VTNWPSSGSRGALISGENPMTKSQSSQGQQQVSDDTILKIAKEISVKFIEVGRLTPATFDETFKSIYQTIDETVNPDD
jgi:hypothetical protein